MGANHSRDEADEAPVQVCSSLCSFCQELDSSWLLNVSKTVVL